MIPRRGRIAAKDDHDGIANELVDGAKVPRGDVLDHAQRVALQRPAHPAAPLRHLGGGNVLDSVEPARLSFLVHWAGDRLYHLPEINPLAVGAQNTVFDVRPCALGTSS